MAGTWTYEMEATPNADVEMMHDKQTFENSARYWGGGHAQIYCDVLG
jgi:hypothetical protein